MEQGRGVDVACPRRKDTVIERPCGCLRQTARRGFGVMPVISVRPERRAEMLCEARSESHDEVLPRDQERRGPEAGYVEHVMAGDGGRPERGRGGSAVYGWLAMGRSRAALRAKLARYLDQKCREMARYGEGGFFGVMRPAGRPPTPGHEKRGRV